MIIFNAIGILLIAIKKLKKMPSNADKSTFLNHNYKEKEATVILALDDKEQLSFPCKSTMSLPGLTR